MVTGIDIVREQIEIASGSVLSIDQQEVTIKGNAIECRINAEDPDKDFAPSPGRIEAFHMPGGPGIRVDTHAYAQYEIPAYYDSLIAKLVAYGPDRHQALQRIKRALDEFVIEGVSTTIPFHRRAVASELFRAGTYDTSFVFELAGEASEEEPPSEPATGRDLSGVRTA
jgi:acetyl-CoA carboxylase biotin carboxylase subunit